MGEEAGMAEWLREADTLPPRQAIKFTIGESARRDLARAAE
jgi:hypothetical protein